MIGLRIKSLRKQKNYSQTELAKILNLSQSTIAYYEKEQKQPSYEVLCKIANLFDVSTDYLLGRTDVPYTYAEGLLLNEKNLNKDELLSKFQFKKADGEEITTDDIDHLIKTLEKLNKLNKYNDRD